MISQSTEATQAIAAELADKVKNGGLLCLYGDLGSGKTTFTKGLAQALGIEQSQIKSPTYTYLREHGQLTHIDLYRLEEIDELLWGEISELLEKPNRIVVIEWAERLKEKMPASRIDIRMKYLDENSREIRIDYL